MFGNVFPQALREGISLFLTLLNLTIIINHINQKEDIEWDTQFVDVISTSPSGKTILNLSSFHFEL